MDTSNRLIYCYDALCGWCYGFSGVLKALSEEPNSLPIEVMSGGMMMGARVEPIKAMAGYILGAYKRVEDTTGVTFGKPYLDLLREGTYISNSLPPAIALTAYKSLKPDGGVPFARGIQKAMFIQGQDLNQPEVYTDLAASLGLDAKAYREAYNNTNTKKVALAEIEQVGQFGVSGFPTLLLLYNGKLNTITYGYSDLQTVRAHIKAITG
jgi:putative protein-disulfide isomerase